MDRSRAPAAIRWVAWLIIINGAMTAAGALFGLIALVFGGGEGDAGGGRGQVLAYAGALIILPVLAAIQVWVAARLREGGSRVWWFAAIAVLVLPAASNLGDHLLVGGHLSVTWIVVPLIGIACLASRSARSHMRLRLAPPARDVQNPG